MKMVHINDENNTLNKQNVTLNKQNVTLNKQNVTLNKQNVTLNKQNVTLNICDMCGKVLSSKQRFNYHISICKGITIDDFTKIIHNFDS
jgi:hypothetical protein